MLLANFHKELNVGRPIMGSIGAKTAMIASTEYFTILSAVARAIGRGRGRLPGPTAWTSLSCWRRAGWSSLEGQILNKEYQSVELLKVIVIAMISILMFYTNYGETM